MSHPQAWRVQVKLTLTSVVYVEADCNHALVILVAACITHPLDLTKLRMQTSPSSSAGPSTLKVLRDTVALTGAKSLYTGLSASVLRQMTYSLVRLGSYEGIKSWISKGMTISSWPNQYSTLYPR
jgi:Mitochondrial carrier protein